ncbi:MAG: PGF-pre-PGF domain-containing protein [Candidatus Pacearchaeota archaeon]|nr:PGF-pre-PGF domain-containing protein [Candidatus Pacearchaeota archaeon]
MVDKKRFDRSTEKFLKVIPKNEILMIVIVLALVAIVLAAAPWAGKPVLNGPANASSWSTLITLSCNSTEVEFPLNATWYYNASGGEIALNGTTYRLGENNTNPVSSDPFTLVVDASSFPDSNSYNVTCVVCNSTCNSTNVLRGWRANYSSQSTINVTIDSKPPRVTGLSILNLTDGNFGNYSNNLRINVSVNDSTISAPGIVQGRAERMNVSSVYFNFSYISGLNVTGMSNLLATREKRGNSWIFAINLSDPTVWNASDGFYYVYVTTNDTVASTENPTGNYNRTTKITILVDKSTAPRVVDFVGTINDSVKTGVITLNVTVWGGNVSDVYFNITNRSGGGGAGAHPTGRQVSFNRSSIAGLKVGVKTSKVSNYYNYTFNSAGFPDGKYNITVFANRTNYTQFAGEADPTNFSESVLNNSEHIQITIDNTAPSATYTCSPSSTTLGQVVKCTCVGSDGTYGSGVKSTTTTTGTITATATGTFSPTCTVTDNVELSTTATGTYTITSVGSGSTGGGGGGSGTTTSKATITPENPATMTGFAEGTGIKAIEIAVLQSVENAAVVVTKYDTKPTAVPVEKTGKVYKYVQISAPDLGTKLKTATITSFVEKTWVTQQGLQKEDVALFKFDEATNKWYELPTTYSKEDTNNYYYTATVSSFSYFVIAAKTVEAPPVEEPPTEGVAGIPLWIWIVAGIVIVGAIVVGGGLAAKKRRK